MGFSLYRASVFGAESFDLNSGGAADFDYAIRAARRGPLYFVSERTGEYRAHAGTTTNTRAQYMIQGGIGVFERYRFEMAHHERRRLRWLRELYRTLAFVRSTSDRMASWRSLGCYLRLGGNPFHPRAAAAVLLTLPPRGVAMRLHASTRGARARLRRASPSV